MAYIETINGNPLAVESFVTPEMFGAKGDGVTDDTAAIQAALDNAGKKRLVFGAKTYLISSSIRSENMIDISGSGTNTVITAASPVTFYINNQSATAANRGASNRGCDIGNMRLHNVGFLLGESTTDFVFGVHLHDCYWHDCDVWCVTLRHKCAFQEFDNLFAENTKGMFYCAGEYEGASVSESGSTVAFRSCFAANSSVACMYVDGVSQDGMSYTVDNCAFEHSPWSVYITGTIHARMDLHCIDLHSESNTEGCIYCDATGAANIRITLDDLWVSPNNGNALFDCSASTMLIINGGFIHRPNSNALVDGACTCVYAPARPNSENLFIDNFQASTFTGNLTVRSAIYQPALSPFTGQGSVFTVSLVQSSVKFFTNYSVDYCLQVLPVNLYGLTLQTARTGGTTNILAYTLASTSVRYVNIHVDYLDGSLFAKWEFLDASFNVVASQSRNMTDGDRVLRLYINATATSSDTFTPILHQIKMV